MKCQKCHSQEATVFFSEVSNQKKIEYCLCEICAKDWGGYIQTPHFAYSLEQFVAKFLESMASAQSSSSTDEEAKTCEHCGMTYQEFHKTGRLGCEHDYEIFRDILAKSFQQVYGVSTHQGKKNYDRTSQPTSHAAILQNPHPNNIESIASMPNKPDCSEDVPPPSKDDLLAQLHIKLQKAIEQEWYEEAAQIHQEIKKLEGRGS